jgi:integrin beta 1
LENQCRMPAEEGNELGLICSDRGECYCGECFCNTNFDGRYCECEVCPFVDGQQCGGSERGICSCGSCQCKPEWKGENCDCSAVEATCIAPDDTAGKLCGEHGKCLCGKCECDENYFGDFCESTADREANNTLCLFYEPCVECILQRKLGQECEDSKLLQHCTSKEGIEYKHEYVDDLSGKFNRITFFAK